jgi:3-phenylpropionate/cinnamic acid dioxygenase small subunit
MVASTGSTVDTGAVEAFVSHEAALLDAGDLRAWLALFADDGCYWVPARRGDSDPARHVSIVYDDVRRLRSRVERLLSGKEYAQLPPSATCRAITNVRAMGARESGEIDVAAVMVVYEKRPTTPMQAIPAHASWRLRPADGDPAFHIVSKRVDLLDVDHHYENLTFIL